MAGSSPDDGSSWRRFLLAACGFALVLLAGVTLDLTQFDAHPGIIVEGTSVAFLDRATVVSGSPAALDGLRNGDLIETNRMSPGDRARLSMGYWMYGDRIVLPVQRAGNRFDVTVAADRHFDMTWNVWLAIAGHVWTLGFAILLSFRRPDNPEARILALQLISFNIGELVAYNWLSPWPALDAFVLALGEMLYVVGLTMLATYSLLFGRPVSRRRQVVVGLAYAVAVGGVIFDATTALLQWLGFVDSNVAGLALYISYFFYEGGPLLLPLLAAALAVAESHGAERTRISWAAGSLAVLYITILIVHTIVFSPWHVDDGTLQIIFNVGAFIAPIGLTYSVLSRRAVDIGFALNRAAVFAATSLLLAGLFAGLQWAANVSVAGVSHAHGILVQLAIAVIVYYVVRWARTRVDTVVSRAFFAQREHRIHVVRALAAEVEDLANAAEVGPFVIAELRSRAALEAAVLLHGEDSAVYSGAFAFPMIVRKRQRGVLVCYPPEEDGDFGPDERRALDALALQMAIVRDDIFAESLETEIGRLRERNRDLETAATLREGL